MSFKHVKIEFSININGHNRDTEYQKQKAIESLQLAIDHIKQNGIKRYLEFDEDGMIPLRIATYSRPYAYPSGTFNSFRRLVRNGYETFDTSTKEGRLIYKDAYYKHRKS